MRRLLAAALLILSLGAAGGARAEPEGFDAVEAPPLVIHYRPGQARLASELAARGPAQVAAACATLGIPAPRRIDAWILPRRTEDPASLGLPEPPEWAAGYALVDRPEIVLRSVETDGAAGNEALTVFQHEIVHCVVSQAVGARRHDELPAWFVEGLATHMAHEWRLTQSAHAAGLALAAPYVPLRQIEARFPQEDSRAQLAYLESFAFLEWLSDRHGDAALGALFARFRAGESFDDAFRHAYGAPWSVLEDRFASWFMVRYRWLPVITSSATLWAVVTVLTVIGGVMKRRRTRAVLQQWEREEALLAAEELVELPELPVSSGGSAQPDAADLPPEPDAVAPEREPAPVAGSAPAAGSPEGEEPRA